MAGKRLQRLTRLTHELLEFPDTQIGHTLYISLVWQNAKGLRGPTAPVQSVLLAYEADTKGGCKGATQVA
jgi:hypothetical protein